MSANLIAFLSVDRVNPPFSSLVEISNQDEYEFGTFGNSTYQTFFEVSIIPQTGTSFFRLAKKYPLLSFSLNKNALIQMQTTCVKVK